MKRKYELVYVVSPDATEAQIADLHAQVDGDRAALRGDD
jgi:ribosomal protein S6